MNRKKFEDIYQYYKENFGEIGQEELYKWEAVVHFQKNWNVESDNFPNMLKTALYKTYNLLNASNYYPNKMIVSAAEKAPEKVKHSFEELFDLTLYLKERIKNFKKNIDEIIGADKTGEKSFQDDRAIMVYLNLRYPDKYYLYKFTMFKDFVELIDYDYIPKKGNIDNIFAFEKLCKYILEYVLVDKELLKMYDERKNEYYDPAYHLLVQDIIYSLYYYKKINNKDIKDEGQKLNIHSFDLKPKNSKTNLQGSHIDYIEVAIQNKRIGDAGERFVYDEERKKVEKYNLPKNKVVRDVAKLDGDGLGYDILSYDKNGNKKYIEVKTTAGPENNNFFITANELAMSEANPDQYYLYRVYNYDNEKKIGDISIRRGSLKELCINPLIYKVVFK